MITIVDYQMGNLRSVQKGFERVGHAATVSGRPEDILTAEKLVLPGVGAFGDCMAELNQRELSAPIKTFIDSGKPFLGICLGLQALFESSEESPGTPGLCVLQGTVKRFHRPPNVKVPHMGWNQLEIRRRAPILAGTSQGSYFYFVHSYYVAPDDDDVVAVEADYHGRFCAMVWFDNLFATQFHPEKSQQQGLQLLQRFAEL